MRHLSTQEVDQRYQRLYPVIAGYLPRDRSAVDEFHARLKERVQAARAAGGGKEYYPSVAALRDLIEREPIIRMYVTEMIDQVPEEYKQICTVDEMLDALNQIVGSAPLYGPVKFPMSALFAYMMMTTAGEAAFRDVAFNDALRAVLQEWCAFLDSPDSRYVLNTGPDGWLSPSAYEYNKLYEFVIPDQSAPYWGWQSFNDYFHRQIKAEVRPIAGPGDPRVVVSANDGTVYKIARGVRRQDRFWIKGQPYSMADVLNHHPEYVDRFVGGDVFQSFLSGANYHRWRAPISGVVRHTELVPALMFSDAESAGFDPDAGVKSLGYEASVNTRGLVYIESDDPGIGMVCVIPIGITEISSVSIQVRVGDRVEKGEELGYFSYGGSTLCLVFQPNAIDHFTVADPPPGQDGAAIDVNAQIAVARAAS